MLKTKSGFTIVELLIVIVVIGILASVTIVAYNGVQANARNAARLNAIKNWRTLLDSYHALHGHYPAVTTPTSTYCLGVDFPLGIDGQPRCRNIDMTDSNYSYLQSNNTVLMNALKTIGNLPRNEHRGISTMAGPYVGIWDTGYYITGVFEGGNGDCPDSLMQDWVSGTGIVLCGYQQGT